MVYSFMYGANISMIINKWKTKCYIFSPYHCFNACMHVCWLWLPEVWLKVQTRKCDRACFIWTLFSSYALSEVNLCIRVFLLRFCKSFSSSFKPVKHGLVAYISHRSRSSKFLNFICVDKFLNWYLYFPIYVKIIYY